MIKIQPFLLPLFALFFGSLFSQILVSQNGAENVHTSAQFEVRSETKGFLPPVMNTSMRKAIQNPAEGLMVFDSTQQKMFVFTRAGWQSLNLTPEGVSISNGVSFPNQNFTAGEWAGAKVQINGDYAYLGAVYKTISGKVQQGAVYVYKITDGIWTFHSQIIAPDGEAGDYFGSDLCHLDSLVFISASGDTYGENLQQGSIYIYKWVNNALVYQSKFTGSNATAGDRFGTDMEAKGKLLVVGAPFDDIGANTDQGAVYFFELESGNWVEKLKYFATSNVGSNDLFGFGTFIDSNFVAVGCLYLLQSGQFGYNRNRISIFQRNPQGIWALHSEVTNPTGENFESFGGSLTLKDDILTIGAIFRDIPTGNKDRGAVYVYKRNGVNWNLIQTLAPMDSIQSDTFGDYFGFHIDMEGKYLLVCATLEDFSSGQTDYGGVFIYEWNGSQFVLLKKLRSPSPQKNEYFGYCVDIQEGKIVVGAPGKNSFSGAAYFFEME